MRQLHSPNATHLHGIKRGAGCHPGTELPTQHPASLQPSPDATESATNSKQWKPHPTPPAAPACSLSRGTRPSLRAAPAASARPSSWGSPKPAPTLSWFRHVSPWTETYLLYNPLTDTHTHTHSATPPRPTRATPSVPWAGPPSSTRPT